MKILVCIVLTLSGCSAKYAKEVQEASEYMIKGFSDADLCEVANDSPESMTPIARAEIQSRGLGDCSEAHLECVQAGFKFGTDGFATCKFLTLQIATAKREDYYRRLGDSIGQGISNLAPKPQPSITTDCRNYAWGVSCTTR